ncbi:MAG TPA: hypothetical protein DDZ88_18620, partial [Verrucomicrobiales bacterium]|nr:hypothetical protein [Verrucomicrobiales bacterium]
MKPLLALLLGATSLLAQTDTPVTSATLDESEVRITYGELKRLVAATLPKEAPAAAQPPVQAALLSTAYQIDAQAGTIIATMQVESFANTWQAVPLAGAASGAISAEPKDAR